MAASGGQARSGLAILFLAVLAFAGCGRGAEPVPTPPPVTSSPSLDPVDSAREFPVTPQEYAELTVAAWATPDLIRLGELTTPAVRDEIVEFPGPPNRNWTVIGCEDGEDSSDCSFYNADGDQLTLTIDHAALGEPRATIAAEIEVTDYPADAEAYLAAFVSAWQAGNLARMENLAVAAVLEALAGPAPPAGAEPAYEVGERSGGLVTVTVTIAGERIDTQLSEALLGEQHAIRTVTRHE